MKKLFFYFAILVLSLSILVSCDVGNTTEAGSDTNATESTESQAEESQSEINSSSAVEEPSTEPITEESEETTEGTEETETEDRKELFVEMVDFVVSVPEGREPVILQLTDTQIIDSSQRRTPDRIWNVSVEYWGPDKKDERCYDYLREIIQNTSPDLIIVTGDIVYGEFDDSGETLLEFVEFMEGFDIPWAPIFGNHDNESKKGVDWQCEQFVNAENCLFVQRSLTGNGNYTIGIEQGGKLTRVFFMLDSNSCGGAQNANSHTKTSPGFGEDQIKWYTKEAKKIARYSPDTKLSFAFHIQLSIFGEAFAKYDTDGSTTVHIDRLEEKYEGDFGYIGRAMKTPWDPNNTVWNGLKELGVDSIFVGHEHANSASIVYDGVRLQYGMKSSAYDRLNYILENGEIICSNSLDETPWVGGTVIKLADDGAISDSYIYYCKNAGGDINWDDLPLEEEETVTDEPVPEETVTEEPVPEEAVEGLQVGSDITLQSGITMTGVQFDESINAYEVKAANQGKVYIKPELVKNKSTFTFTVYVPSSSTAKLGGLGEFAIRIKPNEIEPEGDQDSYVGHINYNSSQKVEDYRIVFDTWQTFTVDISEFDDKCTEFAFIIAAGNTIYLRDLVIE